MVERGHLLARMGRVTAADEDGLTRLRATAAPPTSASMR